MKILCAILLLFASVGSAIGQNWAPFPLDATSEWRVYYSYPVPINHGHDQCAVRVHTNYSVLDSVLRDGKWYTRFYRTGYRDYCGSISSISETSPILVRAENGVYYRKIEGYLESIYADFNMNVGDTVPSIGVIDSTDAVEINGHLCKRQWTNGYGHGDWVIEGIGAAHHSFFFTEAIYGESVCYREFGMSDIFEFNDPYACSITDVPQLEIGREIIVAPNPSSGIFRIETTQASSYRVYDLFGRIINRGQLNGTSELDLTSQPNGIYLISFETENGISTSKLVKQ